MRRFRHTIIILLALLGSVTIGAQTVDYQNDQTYIRLRKDMTRGFNEADSASFYPALQALQDYLLEKNDLHGYYTQRCNEIIFLMNRQKIFEAYKRAREMSMELREKQLDKEMYMAYNMLGHIYRYCGNKESARRCFRDVISRMEQAGYYESMPPIYMNIVNVEINENPEEAMRLLEKAIEIARQYSPERVFDIEARRTAAYYELGDTAAFNEGYAAYKVGEADGRTSVHGRQLEVYNLAMQGKVDEAIELAQNMKEVKSVLLLTEGGYVDLKQEDFYTWTGWDATAEKVNQAGCAFALNQNTQMVYGDANVMYNNFADLSAADVLVLVATTGTPRLLFNRPEPAPGAEDSHGGAIPVELPRDEGQGWWTVTDNGDGTKTYVVDVKRMVEEYGYCHLNAVKGANWADTNVTSMQVGYGIGGEDSSIATLSSDKKAAAGIYTITGAKVNQLSRGINIIVDQNGQSRKVFVK